jgi:ATP-dependent DNA ligase
MYATHVEGRGKDLFQAISEQNLEGIVAKRKSGIYWKSGWQNIKNPTYIHVQRIVSKLPHEKVTSKKRIECIHFQLRELVKPSSVWHPLICCISLTVKSLALFLSHSKHRVYPCGD